jgi:hypothetical protein
MEVKIMKKWIVWMMALIFTLGIASFVFAQAAKDPIPGINPQDKEQIEMSKKKATEPKKSDKMATKPGDVPGLGAQEKSQIEEAKKKPAAKKKATVKKQVPGLGPEEKTQIEEAKKPAASDKKKEAAPAAPAEKK